MLLAAGTILREKYQIIRRIDEREPGDVFEARHLQLAGRYAIKVLCEGGIRNAVLLDALRREALATSELTNPGIVRVYDLDQAPDGSPFIVMEYLHGQNLGRVIREAGPMVLSDVVAIVEAIASPLGEAHRRGIIHGDLTPENVFVLDADADPHARVKLLDFGVAKIRAQAGGIVRDGAATGTPGYRAPELGRGQTWKIDERTDVFALGAIARALISGRAPVVPGATSMGHPVVSEAPAPLPASPAVAAAIERATREPSDGRFQTVTDFAQALRAAAATSPARSSGVRSTRLGATPPVPLPILHSPTARVRLPRSLQITAAVAAGCGIAILLGIVVLTKPARAPQTKATPAVVPQAVAPAKPVPTAPMPAPTPVPVVAAAAPGPAPARTPPPARLPPSAPRAVAAADGARQTLPGHDAGEGGAHHHHHAAHPGMTDAARHEMELSYQKATRAFDVSNYDEAIDAYKKTYELGGDAAMLYNIAQALRLSKRNAEAVVYYRRYLDRAPTAANHDEVRAKIAELGGASPAASPAKVTAPAARVPLDCRWRDHAVAAKPVDVSCSDPQTPVAKVILFYRAAGAGPFTQVEMTKAVRGSYQASVPAAAVSAKGVELYVEGRRASGETAAQSASASHPNEIVVAKP